MNHRVFSLNKTAFVSIAAALFLVSCGDGGGGGGGAVSDCGAVPEPTDIMADPMVTAGSKHSLALRSDGLICAWGDNTFGQLGNGSTAERSLPVQIKGLTDVVKVSAGHNHNLALRNDGTVWSWGSNSSGQLGDSTTVNRSKPIEVFGLSDIEDIAAGELYSMAMEGNGTVWSWGEGGAGQLGNGLFSDSLIPIQVSNLSNIVSIASGGKHALALDDGGELWAWGFNLDGELGNGTITASPPFGKASPGKVEGLSGVFFMEAGNLHSLALKNDGSVYVWGENTHGQLGLGIFGAGTDVALPVTVPNLSDLISISGGFSHSEGTTGDGVVWSWGRNNFGQLGIGNFVDSPDPVMAVGVAEAVSVSGGGSHTLALTDTGEVWAWGDNQSGQLGKGTSTGSSSTAARVEDLVLDSAP